MLESLLPALLATLAPAAIQDEPAPDTPDDPIAELRAELAAAADQPTPKKRRDAAARLSRREGVTIETWLEVAAGFGGSEEVAPGHATHLVPLLVEGEVEETELCVYTPAGYDPAVPAPLMIACHGTGGNGRTLHHMWRQVADRLGMIVLAPSEAGENTGYHFLQRERSSVLEGLRWLRRRWNVDDTRIFLSGISRGGHLTWDLGLRHRDRFAAIAPMIGGPRLLFANGQNNLRYIENAVTLPIRDLQGMRDNADMIFNLRMAMDALDRLGAEDAELIEFPNRGHDFDFGAVDWVDFLGSRRRDPAPERVVLATADADRARAFWVDVVKTKKDVEEHFTPKVKAGQLDGLDNRGQLLLFHEMAVDKTARLEVQRTAPGRFTAEGEGVVSFRLLLTEDMLDERGRVEVVFNGKTKKKKPRPSAKVLLTELVERLDRSFLPTMEFEVR